MIQRFGTDTLADNFRAFSCRMSGAIRFNTFLFVYGLAASLVLWLYVLNVFPTRSWIREKIHFYSIILSLTSMTMTCMRVACIALPIKPLLSLVSLLYLSSYVSLCIVQSPSLGVSASCRSKLQEFYFNAFLFFTLLAMALTFEIFQSVLVASVPPSYFQPSARPLRSVRRHG